MHFISTWGFFHVPVSLSWFSLCFFFTKGYLWQKLCPPVNALNHSCYTECWNCGTFKVTLPFSLIRACLWLLLHVSLGKKSGFYTVGVCWIMVYQLMRKGSGSWKERLITKMNYRITNIGIGRDLWRSSSLIILLNQGHQPH